jgi:serine/threonine protein kinase
LTSARVDVVAGVDAGRSLDLPLGARLVVGRGHDADLRLSDAQVSRRHCALEHGLAGIKVVDLESRTGCVIEQEGRRGPAPTLVAARAHVELGATVLLLTRSTRAQPAPPRVRGVRLLRLLGEGGSGTVWEGARDDGVAVAVKVLLPEADPIARARFEREAGLAARLEHPGIARILGLARADDGRPCLVRALVRGRSLRERIDEGALPWPEVARLGVAVAGALAHAHAHGVVHRDVKPGNVVLEEPGGAPLLIDFDLARRLASTSEQPRATVARLTATGEGLGSLAYVAPEQLLSARDADARSDVYGLGLTLYHAVAGVAPFADVDPEDFLEALETRGPRPLAALAPALPVALRDAIARAHAVRPDDRFASAADLARALDSR